MFIATLCDYQCGSNTTCTGFLVETTTFTCACLPGYVSPTGDGKNCVFTPPTILVSLFGNSRGVANTYCALENSGDFNNYFVAEINSCSFNDITGTFISVTSSGVGVDVQLCNDDKCDFCKSPASLDYNQCGPNFFDGYSVLVTQSDCVLGLSNPNSVDQTSTVYNYANTQSCSSTGNSGYVFNFGVNIPSDYGCGAFVNGTYASLVSIPSGVIAVLDCAESSCSNCAFSEEFPSSGPTCILNSGGSSTSTLAPISDFSTCYGQATVSPCIAWYRSARICIFVGMHC